MSTKESKSLQFNEVSWKASYLGEQVILLECPKDTPIEIIHRSVRIIEAELQNGLKDIVPAYHSIAIFGECSIEDLQERLSGKSSKATHEKQFRKTIKLPICYELGLDLDRVSKHTGLSVEDIIDMHLKGTYRSVFIGFTPGFIYADGLNPQIACPRLENPRQKIPNGSVGIAGNQTGIYSLASPGGWNIIGRTPKKIFDVSNDPPMLIDVGMSYKFFRITKEEFEAWEK
ncbi:5-oxoprolinase subunit PxpB [Ekhidna sp.]|uniref:5-oxoprolinase subunit PxpB n=1 Tax=Ekhidna sp. TaxID=2608089 RepID=UPI003CCB978E